MPNPLFFEGHGRAVRGPAGRHTRGGGGSEKGPRGAWEGVWAGWCPDAPPRVAVLQRGIHRALAVGNSCIAAREPEGGGKDGRQMVVVVPICKFCEEPCSSLAPLAPWRGRCRGGPLRLLVPGPPPAPPLPGPDLTPVKPERREGLNCKKTVEKSKQKSRPPSFLLVGR